MATGGFDYMTQPQGVTIPISLFGDASRAGIAAGNASPSTLGAIAQGVTGGIQNYQTVTQNFQVEQLNQAKIDQIPIDNQIKMQQLENDKATNQLQKIQLSNKLAVSDIEVKNETAKAQQELTVNTSKLSVYKAIQSGDKDLIYQAGMKDGLPAFAADSNLAYQFWTLPTVQQSQAFTPEQLQAGFNSANAKINAEKQAAQQARQAQDAYNARVKATNEEAKNWEALKSETTAALPLIISKASGNKFNMANNFELIPMGARSYDANTGQMFPVDPSIEQANIAKMLEDRNTNPTKGMEPLTYQLFDTGKASDATADPKAFGLYMKWRNSYEDLVGQPLPAWSVKNAPAPSYQSPASPGVQQNNSNVQPGSPSPAPQTVSQVNSQVGGQTSDDPNAAVNRVAYDLYKQKGAAILNNPANAQVQTVPGISNTNLRTADADMRKQMAQAQGVPPVNKEQLGQVVNNVSAAPFKNTADMVSVGKAEPIMSTQTPKIPDTTSEVSESGGGGTGGGGTGGGGSNIREDTAVPKAVTPQAVETSTTVPNVTATTNADANLSNMTGTPVKLKTNVHYNVPKQVYLAANTNPLVAGESALIKGVATVESGIKPYAVSPTGVHGIMQVSMATARDYGLDARIPSQNVEASKRYLTSLITMFKGDLRLALTSYNAGQGTVLDAVKRAGTTYWPAVQKELKVSLSPGKYKETENYADKVISASAQYVQPGNNSDKLLVDLLGENGLIT